MGLYAPPDEFPLAAQFPLPVAFVASPVRTVSHFSAAVLDRANSPARTLKSLCFCAAAQMEMVVCIIKDLLD